MSDPLDPMRRRINFCLLAVSVMGAAWFFSPGIPVLFKPTARESVRIEGHTLFVRDWQPNDELAHGDGLGPVFNATSCAACHFQGGIGGAGPNEFNVTAFKIRPTVFNPEANASGLIHHHAVEGVVPESNDVLTSIFPTILGRERTIHGCGGPVTIREPDLNPVSTQSINTTALFGAGWIDAMSPKAITAQYRMRAIRNSASELSLKFATVPDGRPRMLPGGKIGKFGWKAQFATLEEFVAAACANEIGLDNPIASQAKPITIVDDPDFKDDLSHKQLGAMTSFVATLPRPEHVWPKDAPRLKQARRGEEVFGEIGCAACHVPDIGGIKSVYSDFLLHRIGERRQGDGGGSGGSYGFPFDEREIKPPTGDVKPDEWRTPPLWGVADSAPYLHDGSAPTLDSAIRNHGGAAERVTGIYEKLPGSDQSALIAFLTTLRAPFDTPPASPPDTQLSRQ